MDALDCPCCGGTPRTIRDTSSDYMRDWSWGIECQNCGLGLEGRDTESAAIADWNRRGGIMNVNQALDRLKGGDSEDKEIAAAVEAEIEDKKASLDMMRSRLGERETLLRQCREKNKRLEARLEHIKTIDHALGERDRLRAENERMEAEWSNCQQVVAKLLETQKEDAAEIERLKRIAEIFNTVAEERSVALREVDQLTREIRYLRHYGNKDCTHMADQAMANGELEDK